MILETKLHEKIQRLKSTSSVFPDEGARLSLLASHVPENGVIVELGSCWGRSACYMAAGLNEVGRNADIHCVDLWDLGVDTPDRHHHPDAFRQFENNLRYCGLWDYIHPIKSDTVGASKNWSLPIDLLFIDAGHKYAEVLADYRAWSPFVKLGGVLAMGASIVVLFLLPWLDRCPVKSIRYRSWVYKVALMAFAVTFIMLGYLGLQPPTATISTCIPRAATSTKPTCRRSRRWSRKARRPR